MSFRGLVPVQLELEVGGWLAEGGAVRRKPACRSVRAKGLPIPAICRRDSSELVRLTTPDTSDFIAMGCEGPAIEEGTRRGVIATPTLTLTRTRASSKVR